MNKLVFSIPLLLIFGVIGCAILQEPAPMEISASRLTCQENPEMVDGDLETVGIFTPKGVIRKGFERSGSVVRHQQHQRQYQRQVEGSPKTETLIKLDIPTYIAYVEIYPASTIPRFALDTTAEEKSSNRSLAFEPVKDKRGEKIKSTQPVRFRIGRKIRYLRLTAYALEDLENVEVYSEEVIKEMEATARERGASRQTIEELQREWRTQKTKGEMRIPLKGAAIREVKFYGREPS